MNSMLFFPGPPDALKTKRKKQEKVNSLFGFVAINYSDLTRETGCPYIKLNLRTYWVRK